MDISSEQFVLNAIDAERNGELFPVDFDDVWPGLGYSRKDSAVKLLKSDDFQEGVDYRHLSAESLRSVNSGSLIGSSPSRYFLAVDGFKMLCMVARTQEAKEARLYFIDVEKRYREQLERQFRVESSPIAAYTDVSALYAQMADLHRENAHLKDQLQALQQARAEVIETSNTRKVFLPNKESFSIPLQVAMDVIGYTSDSYLRNVLKNDFTEEMDWQRTRLGEIMLTEAALHELAIVARAKRGAKSDHLPEILVVERDRMFRSAEVRSNTRFGRVAE